MNRLIFIDNKTFSSFYTVEYGYKYLPKYVQNTYKNTEDDKTALAEEVYIHLNKTYEEEVTNTGDITKLIFAIEKDINLHYLDFSYKNLMICSNLGIINTSISKLFLHSFNKNIEIKITKELGSTKIIESNQVKITRKNLFKKEDEERTIESLQVFSEKIQGRGRGDENLIIQWINNLS